MRPRTVLRSLAAIALLAVAACGGGSGAGGGGGDRGATDGTTAAAPTTATPGAPSKVTGDVTVFAAASLTESFTALGKAFEAANPGTKVTFNFAASSALVGQIGEGAPADVFASADEATMKKLTDAGRADGTPVIFARNELAIIVAKGNPKKIASVKDLTDPKLLVVVAAPQVPVGAYAAQVFQKAGVTVRPVSLEENVKAVVTKVTSGEADAGVVYATDVRAAGDKAEAVAIPDDLNVVVRYPIAVVAGGPNAAAARAFVSAVTSPAGVSTLATFGFAAP